MVCFPVARHYFVIGVEASMTEEELRQLLKTLGWGLQLRARRKSGKRYAYARRKVSGKVQAVYLCPESSINQLDKETLEQKLR